MHGRYMKKIILVLSILFSGHALALDDAVNTGRFSDTAIDGYDAVAYHTEQRAIEGSDDHEFEWRGGVWRFASAENRALFAADPEKYAPQYGGWCAYAMSDRGRTVRIDPEAWTLKHGKLYLNYSKRVRSTWLEDLKQNISEADGFYPQTTDVEAWRAKERS